MQSKTKSSRKEFAEWESLLESVPKLAVPVDFIRNIIFYYPDGREVVLDIAEVTDDLKGTLEHWIESNYANSKKISMIVDVEKVKAFIEPITKNFLSEYFDK